MSKNKAKEAFDRHRHDNTRYSVDEVVDMRRAPTYTRESQKLLDQYHGPLVITEVLPGDVYRVAELDS